MNNFCLFAIYMAAVPLEEVAITDIDQEAFDQRRADQKRPIRPEEQIDFFSN